MNQNEQDQISKTMTEEQEAKRLASEYLSGKMTLKEYVPLAHAAGPHIDLRALGAFWHRREQEEMWENFAGQLKSVGHSVLEFFSQICPR